MKDKNSSSKLDPEKKYQMQLKSEERQHIISKINGLKMAGIICSAILGFIGIVGAFWGKEGLEFLGFGVLAVTLTGIWVMASRSTSYYY